tara:strand:- start:616 stop:858 length:243 start_codon:yes stop_codon:yes gene_type:complete
MRSEILRNLEVRIARLEKRASRPTVEKSLFSVNGESPETGKEILEVTDYHEDYREALEVAFNQGYFVGYGIEDIELVEKR